MFALCNRVNYGESRGHCIATSNCRHNKNSLIKIFTSLEVRHSLGCRFVTNGTHMNKLILCQITQSFNLEFESDHSLKSVAKVERRRNASWIHAV